jgi:hypothetical protein
MELIPYPEFARLRMNHLAPGRQIFESDDWEWMGGLWKNEGIRTCTSVSYHEDMPDEAGGLEVDFRDLPGADVLAIFAAIHLPLRPGMTLQEVCAVLGEPEETHMLVHDRKTYDFTVGSCFPYYVSTSVHQADGLVYVAVIRRDVLSRCHD